MGFNRSRFSVGFAIAMSLAVATPSGAAAPTQVTEDHSGSGCASTAPVVGSAGTIAAWQSNCSPAGGNADGSSELFRATVGSAPVQLTSGSGCSSMSPSISANGNVVAFESDCNLTGGNADGNVEIFLWKNGAVSQLTTSTGCDNLAPSINGAGTFIAFDSTCNLAGTANGGRGSEIFRVSATGLLQQLTVDPNGGACDSTSASIDTSGKLVAFDSDCDLVGKNADFAIEIYTVTDAGVVKQQTFALADSCSSVRPAMAGDDSIIAFQSDCDFTGSNLDQGDEIFTVDSALAVRQITNASTGPSCVSGEPRMAASGHSVAFSSYCPLAGSNGDGSVEVFQVGVGKGLGGILAVTDGAGCASLAGGLSSDGTRVAFDSDCNPAGGNADGGIEIFEGVACVCGGPSTRKLPPKASDALSTLRAAVAASACASCECDVDNSGTVTAGDALRVLKAAVGQQGITLTCPQ